jgi:hypothetical protein
MKALGLGRLRNLQPKVPVQRYQWEKPGDMIHVDTKQLARFERIGHRITSDRRRGCCRGAGYEKVRVAIVGRGFPDAVDATRLACLEVLPDEQEATTLGFLTRAVGWCCAQGNRVRDAKGCTCRRLFTANNSSYRLRE